MCALYIMPCLSPSTSGSYLREEMRHGPIGGISPVRLFRRFPNGVPEQGNLVLHPARLAAALFPPNWHSTLSYHYNLPHFPIDGRYGDRRLPSPSTTGGRFAAAGILPPCCNPALRGQFPRVRNRHPESGLGRPTLYVNGPGRHHPSAAVVPPLRSGGAMLSAMEESNASKSR